MYFFTGDEHYEHANIVKVGMANRPFADVDEMREGLISRHNEVVGKNDFVVHAADFCFGRREVALSIIARLNGQHTFLDSGGRHDKWLKGTEWGGRQAKQIWNKKIEGEYIVVCHYAMHTWARSHYNSWHLYAHSHMELNLPGKRRCISVDVTDFYPVSFEQVVEWMAERGDNPNFLGGRKG